MTLKEFNRIIRDIFYAEPLMTEEEEKIVDKFLKMLRDVSNKEENGRIPEKNRAPSAWNYPLG